MGNLTDKKERVMRDKTYKFGIVEIRTVIQDACMAMFRNNTVANEVYMGIMNPLEDFLYEAEQTEPQTGLLVKSPRKSRESHEKDCSGLTFERRTMRDCYNCERYESERECVECHYEPKGEADEGHRPHDGKESD